MRDGRVIPHVVDPFIAIDGAVEDDPYLLQLGRLLSSWAANVGTGLASKITVKNLVDRYGPGLCALRPDQQSKQDPDTPPLSEVLLEIAGSAANNANTTINTRKLGTYISGFKNRLIAGRRFCQGEPNQNALTWWVEDVGESCDSSESALSDSKKQKGNVVSIGRKQNSLTKATEVTKTAAEKR